MHEVGRVGRLHDLRVGWPWLVGERHLVLREQLGYLGGAIAKVDTELFKITSESWHALVLHWKARGFTFGNFTLGGGCAENGVEGVLRVDTGCVEHSS